MRCADLHTYFREAGTWVNWDRPTDGFKAGDPNRPLDTAVVVWKPSFEVLREAQALGAQMVIAHESLTVNAVNGDPRPEKEFALPTEEATFRWLEESGLVVYRCHDFWDQYPKEGIRSSWQHGLKLNGEVIADEYPLMVTEISPMTVGDLARHILQLTAPLGQTGVLVNGAINQMVVRVGTGTGASANPLKMRALGADAGIIVDDFYSYVRMGVHTHELNFPTIAVNHGVAEEWGIRNLADHIERKFTGLNVRHIQQRCVYTVLT